MDRRRPERVYYAMDRVIVIGRRNSPGVEYNDYDDFDYGGYHAIDTVPVRYSLQENYNGAYGPQNRCQRGGICRSLWRA